MRVIILLVCLALAACSGDKQPPKSPAAKTPAPTPAPKLEQVKDGNFVLCVSNQSFDLPIVDITVEIDGAVAVSDDYEVKDQHNVIEYEFNLPKGQHSLKVSSSKGDAVLEKEFNLETARTWTIINFWYARETNKGKRFSFSQSDKPVLFL